MAQQIVLDKYRDQIISKIMYDHVRVCLQASGFISAADDEEIRTVPETDQMKKMIEKTGSRPQIIDALIAALEMCDHRKLYADLSQKMLVSKITGN